MSGEPIVAAARLWLGTPYRHQASRLGAGCDCLGLVRGVWRTLYGAEPCKVPPYSMDRRNAADADALMQAAAAWLVARDGAPQVGDVLLFRLARNLPPRHCGILVGPDEMVHAQEGLGVVTAALGESWRRRLCAGFSFPDR